MTPRECQCLSAISALTRDGVAPTYDHLCAALGVKHKSGINRIIVSLEAQGKVTRRKHCRNSVAVVSDLESAVSRLIATHTADVVAAELERQRGRG